MSDYLPFLAAGLASGSIYSLAGVGLVLTFRTSGVFNFAHGAVAAVGAFAFYELRDLHGVPWPIAFALSLAGVGIIGGLLLELVARRLANARATFKVVATVGLLLAIQGAATARYGANVRSFPPFLPTGTLRIAGTNVGYDQCITAAIALVAAGGLYVFLRRSRLGIAMRAVVDDPDLLALTATSPRRVRRASWIIGAMFATASGILIAPSLGLDALLLTFLVVQAFGAAAVGRFESLPLTYLGGLAVGIASDVSKKFIGEVPSLAGLPASTPFLVLFVVLVTMKPSKVKLGAPPRAARSAPGDPLPRPLVNTARALGGLALLAVPWLAEARLPVFTMGAAFVVLFLSLGLLVWTSNQISLAHAGFAAIGATTFCHLATGAGLPWLVAVLGATLAVVPVGAGLALPAVRLSGIYLALATLGFGILLERLIFPTGIMFGAFGNRIATRPQVFDLDTDRRFYFVVLTFAVGASLVVALLLRSRLGRLLRALADSPTALETYGASVLVTRVLVFAVSAGMAGTAGALMASASTAVTGTAFSSFSSIVWLTVLAISGRALPRSSVIAAGLLIVMPAYVSPETQPYQFLGFGVLAIAAAVLSDGGWDWRGWLRVTADPARAQRSPVASRLKDTGWRSPTRGRTRELAATGREAR